MKKHHEGDFYVAQAYFDVIDKKSPNFEKEVEQAKKCAKLLADPEASLEVEGRRRADPHRRHARHALPQRLPRAESQDRGHRRRREQAHPEGAGRSRLDQALRARHHRAAANLRAAGPDREGRLELEAGAGRSSPPNAYQDAAKAWVKANADTYRIQRFVEEKKDEKRRSRRDGREPRGFP